MNNPFFTDYNMPYDAVPFSKFKTEDFIPAIKKSIELTMERINKIVENNEEPNFENTILALETSEEELNYVMSVYWHLFGSESDNELKSLAEKISPMGSKLKNDILLNSKLFNKIKIVYQNKNNSNLDEEDIRLIDVTYKSFIKNGADLNEFDKQKIREIDQKLSLLSPQFSNNVLNAQNKYELWIDNENDLDGLPDSSISMAKEAAIQKQQPNKWLFTLQYPSMGPFLNYSKNRSLRKELVLAYGGLCHIDEFNNNEIIKEIVQLKHKRANLLGYNTFADYVLNDRMALNVNNVYKLLDDLYDNCFEKAKKELDELKNYAKKLDDVDDFKPWDQSYYSTKLKKEKFNIDPEMLRPYFKAENVINGIFTIANKMYGIKFKELNNADTWHEEVKCYEITNADDSLVGLIYIDLHPRPTKRSGAWMSSIKDNGFFYYEDKFGGLKLPMPNVLGQFQLENISTAIATLRTLDLGIEAEHIERGIQKINNLARLLEIKYGKLKELINSNKLLVSGDHNPDGARVLNEYLQSLDCNKHVIIGMMSNKQHEEYISYFKDISSITTIDIPNQINAISGLELKDKFKNHPNVQNQASIEEAIKSIPLKENDLLLITGSLYLAGEVLNLN